jgi:hypothetical protein
MEYIRIVQALEQACENESKIRALSTANSSLIEELIKRLGSEKAEPKKESTTDKTDELSSKFQELLFEMLKSSVGNFENIVRGDK